MWITLHAVSWITLYPLDCYQVAVHSVCPVQTIPTSRSSNEWAVRLLTPMNWRSEFWRRTNEGDALVSRTELFGLCQATDWREDWDAAIQTK